MAHLQPDRTASIETEKSSSSPFSVKCVLPQCSVSVCLLLSFNILHIKFPLSVIRLYNEQFQVTLEDVADENFSAVIRLQASSKSFPF